MNILPIQFTPQKNSIPAFTARKVPSKKLAQLTSDVVEFSTKRKQPFPPKMELTETEQKFDEVFTTLNRVNANLHTQKQLLHSYYSAQDKYEYQELSKTARNLSSKLRRMAKTYDVDLNDIEISISTKKIYNRYAPKILRCQSREDLMNVKNLISDRVMYPSDKEMLEGLIAQKMKEF